MEPAGSVPSSTVAFAYNPVRRGGEWTIADQATNRYPLWTEQYGFPASYNSSNPPIIYVIRTNSGKFHARFTKSNPQSLRGFPDNLKQVWLGASKGGKGVINLPAGSTGLTPLAGRVVDALQHHGSVLLYGPPGTGKTLLMQEIEQALRNSSQSTLTVDSNDIVQPFRQVNLQSFPRPISTAWVTFHQTMSYEDFIVGLRPKPIKNGVELEPRAGLLLDMAEQVRSTGGSAFLFIDEINRANVSKVFGEFVTLIERDKRLGQSGQPILGRTASVNLPMLDKANKTRFPDGALKPVENPYSMPYHVYLVASMNSLDRSVMPLDTALARRFFRIEVPVNYDELARRLGLSAGFQIPDVPNSVEEVAIALLTRVNDVLLAALGDDFQLGQSYVWNVGESGLDENGKWEELVASWESGIVPQVVELLRANPDYLEKLLRASSSGRPHDYPYSRSDTGASVELDVDPPVRRLSMLRLSDDDQKSALRFLARKTPP
jgi:energy-coupling factor transporter ATP-binding protein EcfA2